ncbi:MAG: hypothetical protein APF77_15080 [Clostridia bacterium BRH_c25]|nr:MAG: hypothetical protein APF77_15080 [Clostridia bacterium BRH_c25]
MINWYWIYRDFVNAYDSCPKEDKWLKHYEEFYLKPNNILLQNIHFKPRGFDSLKDVLSRINEQGFACFEGVRNSIGDIKDFECMIQNTANDILKRFGNNLIDTDVYVIVGLDCTNIYSIMYNGKNVTVICLESVKNDVKVLNLLLSHEIHHWVRERNTGAVLFGNCVGERAVTEGLAINCSEFLFPGYEISDYCYVPESSVNWVKEHWKEVDQIFLNRANDSDISSGFFTRNKTTNLIKGMPSRIGYVYGSLKVSDYIERRGRNPIELVGISWSEFF